jgi:hypothetical protein
MARIVASEQARATVLSLRVAKSVQYAPPTII